MTVVLRTLGGIPFIAIYEVSAHIGQPQIINNVTTAQNSNNTNNNASNRFFDKVSSTTTSLILESYRIFARFLWLANAATTL